jgi:uncharacterized membrane protein
LWKIRTIKKDARHFMLKNYFTCVLVSLIMVCLIQGPVAVSENIETDTQFLSSITQATGNSAFIRFGENVLKLKNDVIRATSIGADSSGGVIAGVYHDTIKSGGIELALVDGINNAFFKGEIGKGVVSSSGLLLTFFFYVFLRGLLRIGICRFYLETRLYPQTSLSRILFIYRLKRILRAGGVVAWKALWLLLWGFTIVGLPIKYFSYYLVPYIVAENPDVRAREALRLSMRLMKGNKRRAFLFEISFIGWYILSIPTFGLLQYLYIDPYLGAARAELYMNIREKAKSEALEGTEILNDKYLETPFEATDAGVVPEETEAYKPGHYPVPLFPIPELTGRRWVNADYHVHYTLFNLILLFFVFSFIGWIWECSLELLRQGMFVNRGTLYGPWLPIYGTGGVAVLLLLRKFIDRPVTTFFLVMFSCGIIEYVTAWALETFLHMKYWDYSGYFFNIQGRVCLEGLLVFAVAGTSSIYIFSPMISSLLDKIPFRIRGALCGVLVAAFGADCVYALFHPHTGPGITSGNN